MYHADNIAVKIFGGKELHLLQPNMAHFLGHFLNISCTLLPD